MYCKYRIFRINVKSRGLISHMVIQLTIIISLNYFFLLRKIRIMKRQYQMLHRLCGFRQFIWVFILKDTINSAIKSLIPSNAKEFDYLIINNHQRELDTFYEFDINKNENLEIHFRQLNLLEMNRMTSKNLSFRYINFKVYEISYIFDF